MVANPYGLTVPEAAAALGTCDETIRRMLRSGRLVGIRLGGKKSGWRIPASEIERMLRPPVLTGRH